MAQQIKYLSTDEVQQRFPERDVQEQSLEEGQNELTSFALEEHLTEESVDYIQEHAPELLNAEREKLLQAAGQSIQEKYTGDRGISYFKINPATGSPEAVPATFYEKNYLFSKRGLIVAETLVFFFFFAFGITAYILSVVEADVGSGSWPFCRGSMIAILTVYTGVGFFALGLYLYFQIDFSRNGEEQVDDFVGNFLAVLTMYAISVGLLARYFTLDIDNSTDDRGLRRLIYVVFESFAFLALVLVIRGLIRHTAAVRWVVIGQTWKIYSDRPHFRDDDKTTQLRLAGTRAVGQPDQKLTRANIAKEFFIAPGYGRYVYLVFMVIYSSTLIGFTVWLIVKCGVAVDSIPEFQPIYLSYFIVLGIMIVLLWIFWIFWSVEAKLIKGPFAAHFDVYYITNVILPVIVIFMLIGFRYVYSKVPDDFFMPPTVVPALKYAYFQKIVMIQFLLLPLVSLGIAKGATLLANLFPVDLYEVKKSVLQRMK